MSNHSDFFSNSQIFLLFQHLETFKFLLSQHFHYLLSPFPTLLTCSTMPRQLFQPYCSDLSNFYNIFKLILFQTFPIFSTFFNFNLFKYSNFLKFSNILYSLNFPNVQLSKTVFSFACTIRFRKINLNEGTPLN